MRQTLLHNLYMETSESIRVAIADDHAVVQNLIAALINKQTDMKVIATAADGAEAVDIVKEHQPDVIVMDISMPKLDGLRASKAISQLNVKTRIIILSMHHNSALIQQAMRLGVSSYISKQNATTELLPAIRSALQS